MAELDSMSVQAEEPECDKTPACPAALHHLYCLGLYRTANEIEHGIVPPIPVLAGRCEEELKFRRLLIVDCARNYGIGDADG